MGRKVNKQSSKICYTHSKLTPILLTTLNYIIATKVKSRSYIIRNETEYQHVKGKI